jgi:hypothetical protein
MKAPRRDDSRATPIGLHVLGDFRVSVGASEYCGAAASEIGSARSALADAIEKFIPDEGSPAPAIREPMPRPGTDAERAASFAPFLTDKEW